MNKTAASRAVAVVVFAIGVTCISSGSIFVRVADAPAIVKSAYRVGISALVFASVSLVFYRREYACMTKKDFALSALSGVFLALHFATWIASLDYTSVASSVMLVGTIPIWVAIFNVVLGITRPSRMMWFCVCLSVAGACIVGYGDISLDGNVLFGDVLAVAGAIAAAAYIMCGKEARKKLGMVSYVTLCYGSAAIVIWCAVLALGYPITGYDAATWRAFFGLALLSQVMGHTSYNWALGHFSSAFVGIMLLGEPLGSAVLAYYLFNEVPAPIKFVGFALLLASIVLAARDESR
ncbi:MAG: DMT family transporter [Synergistaceae bacterium]|jgi:drug/metabolite transporter (DMT)-like permease|nr:DMT family transporter [Synergistaceae bacterium]